MTEAAMPAGAESALHPRLTALIAAAGALPPVVTAVVFPGDAMAIDAALMAARLGIVDPVFYGSAAARDALSAAHTTSAFRWIETGVSPRAAAAAAVADAAAGRVAILMKGSLHTDELLGAVLARDTGLRGATRLTHTFVFDLPRYHKLLAITDAVVNIAPDVHTKAHSIAHAVELMAHLGVVSPKVAVIAAVETVHPSINATVDAQTLAEWGRAGRFGSATVEGPLGFDNAISAQAAAIKGIASAVAGDPDILLVPELNAGNMLYKSFIYMGGGECAGIVQGAKVPIVLTSRADSLFSRVASCALSRIALSKSA